MNLCNQKQVAGGTEFLVGEIRNYNEKNSYRLEHIDYYKKIVNLALAINKGKIDKNKTINKKEITYAKISARTSHFNHLSDLYVEILTDDKKGTTIKNRLEIGIDYVSGKSRHFKDERNHFLQWSGILAVAATGMHFVAKATSAAAGSIWGEFASVIMGLGAIHIFVKAIGYAIGYQKFKNPLLAIVALEKGLYATEVTEKALENLTKTKQKKKS